MAIIKLTDLLGEPTYFNKNHITSFYRAKNGNLVFTVIWIAGIKYDCKVKETPEEILALINGEVGLDEKPCKDFMGYGREWIAKEAKEKGLTFKECLLFIYFYENLAKKLGTKEQMIKEIETCKAFSKAAVKAYSLIKEAENGK